MQELPEELEIELTKRVGVLAAAFPGVISGETISVYVRTLADLPLEVLDAAVEQCVAECKFRPTVAELRDKALKLATPAGSHPTSAEAWGLVVAAIRAVGSYGRPTFKDPLVARAVEVMDWRQLCMSEQPSVDRAQFMRIYEQLVARELDEARLLSKARELRALTAASIVRLVSPGRKGAEGIDGRAA